MFAKDIAYEVGITRQELRHELQQTNFGIDPNSKEIPDSLAQGIIRRLAPKYKARKKELMKKESASRKAEEMVGIKSEEKTEEVAESKEKIGDFEVRKKSDKPQDFSGPLVFRSSIEVRENKVKLEEKEKQEREELERIKKEREELENKEVKESKEKDWGDPKKKLFPRRDSAFNVTRKIEFTEDEKLDAKKKRKKKGAQQEHVQHKSFKRLKIESISEQDLTKEDRVAMIAEEEMRRKLEDEAFKASQAKRKDKLQKQKKIEESIVKKEGVIEIAEIITVKEFSEKTGVPISIIITTLLKNGIMATINTAIDYDTWLILADELDVQLKKKEMEHSIEDILGGDIMNLMKDDEENLESRPPVIVVMGHVDHGKTSILDFYRNTKVIDQESGGITQHIGAYQVEKKNKLITFIDTPGHEAFTAMRARGAKTTDVAILVVAADEGIKEQTKEAYNHVKEAGVPVVVAINKIDKEGADVDRIKGDLMGIGLIAEDYGGETIMVPVSAKTGEGMEELLDSILLQSEILELKANPNRNAIATIIESNLDKSLGPVATVVVNTGTLKIGDTILVGSVVGKIRTMTNFTNKMVKQVPPSGVVQITGFERVPNAGDILQVVVNEKVAREKANRVADLRGEKVGHSGLGMDEILARIQSGKMNLLKIVLKADTIGSIEAIRQSFTKIKNTEVGVKVIHAATGAITESDVMMAAAAKGLVIGFHAKISPHVRQIAERENVEVQIYEVIYNLIEDIKNILTGMLIAEEIEIETGKAEIKAIFLTSKKKQIIGAKVISGSLKNKSIAKLYRGNELLLSTNIENLRSFDKNVDEIKSGNECGIQFFKNLEVEEGDILVCYRTEKKMKTL